MNTETKALVEQIYTILDFKKLNSIEVLDVGELTTLAEVFIIAVGANTRQTKGAADELQFKMNQKGIQAYQKEGQSTSTWILMDYNEVMVHIFNKEEAEFYELDKMWYDAKRIIMAKDQES